MRSEKAIRAEIEKLEAMKPKVRRYSAFGDDHHAVIDAQVKVLEGLMTSDKSQDLLDEDFDGEYVPEIDETLDWLWGKESDSPPAPSEGWLELVQS